MDLIPARVLVALVIFTSCADPSLREPSVGASTPDTATIRCDDDGSMEVLTPAVQAQPDGVHIEVHVPEDSDLGFSVRECCGFNAEDGSFIVPVPPGRMNVGCLTPEQDAGDDSLYHEIRVVDKEGAYISDELRCEGAMGVGSGDAGPSAGEDPLTVPGRS